MENKKLGAVLIVLSIAVGALFVYYTSSLTAEAQELGCFPSQECLGLERALSISHIAVGVFSFILALGIYLLLFNKSEQAILQRLEEEKNAKIADSKFEMLFKALDPFEQKVVKAVREQQGITQNTLRLRLDMSKAKLSYVLQELEKRGIIKRVEKGKTLAVYLRV